MEIKVCPSLLLEGYETYSTEAIKHLFNALGTREVSLRVEIDFEKEYYTPNVTQTICHTAISGVQEKVSASIVDGCIRLTPRGVRGTHIIKPSPMDNCLTSRKQVPANEH